MNNTHYSTKIIFHTGYRECFIERHYNNELTASATLFAKSTNAEEDLFPRSSVNVWSILNTSSTFGSAGGAVVVAACDAQWVDTVSCSHIVLVSLNTLVAIQSK